MRAFVLGKEVVEMKQLVSQCQTMARTWRWRASSLLLLLLALPAAPAGVVKIERISPPPLDLEVTLPSAAPSQSADGRFVAFQSDADDLVPGDTNGKRDVFVAKRG